MSELSTEKAFDLLRAVFNNSRDAVVICDAHGTLSFFNRATRELHGITEEELPPTAWAERYQLHDEADTRKLTYSEIPLYRALIGERFTGVVMTIRRADGKHVRVSCEGNPLFDEDGEKIGAIAIMRRIDP